MSAPFGCPPRVVLLQGAFGQAMPIGFVTRWLGSAEPYIVGMHPLGRRVSRGFAVYLRRVALEWGPGARWMPPLLVPFEDVPPRCCARCGADLPPERSAFAAPAVDVGPLGARAACCSNACAARLVRAARRAYVRALPPFRMVVVFSRGRPASWLEEAGARSPASRFGRF